jgi:hypothetical protein
MVCWVLTDFEVRDPDCEEDVQEARGAFYERGRIDDGLLPSTNYDQSARQA